MKIYYKPEANENGKFKVFQFIYDRDIAIQYITINDDYKILYIDEKNKTLIFQWKEKLKTTYDRTDVFNPIEIPLEIEITESDKLEGLRTERNQALQESDWKMASDVEWTVAEKQSIKDYRQSLRDITEPIKAGTKTVDEITLPEPI